MILGDRVGLQLADGRRVFGTVDRVRPDGVLECSTAPQLRLAPEVQALLDEQKPPRTFGDLDVLAVPGLDDKILLMARHQLEAEQRAFAAGYELGPLEFEHEQTDSGWRITATQQFRPRSDR